MKLEEIEPVIPAKYDGMTVRTIPYLETEDFGGVVRTYLVDVIERAPEIPAAADAVGTDAKRPAVIFLHGGGHMNKCDRRQGYVPVFARELTKHGCVVFAPDYPVFDSVEQRNALGGRMAGCPKTAAAVHSLYGFIQAHAEEFRADPERIAIMGGSAGGWTAFHAVADYPQDRYRFLGNCWGTPEDEIDFSHFPPTLSIHGTADQAVPFELEAPVQAALETAGIPHDLVALEGSPHTPVNRFAEYAPLLVRYLNLYMKD